MSGPTQQSAEANAAETSPNYAITIRNMNHSSNTSRIGQSPVGSRASHAVASLCTSCRQLADLPLDQRDLVVRLRLDCCAR